MAVCTPIVGDTLGEAVVDMPDVVGGVVAALTGGTERVVGAIPMGDVEVGTGSLP